MKKILLGLVIALIIIGSITLFLISKFSLSVGRPPLYFAKEFVKSVQAPDLENLNILILGLDYRNDSLEKTQTTDTIIFASFNIKTHKLKLLSLPRDLWDSQTHQKINQFYPSSLNQAAPFTYLKENYSRITGHKIDRIIVLTTDNLISLISFVGSVEVELEKGFVDHEFPNPEYVKNPVPSVSKYITVEFPAGLNRIDSTNVTYFVRSRKSAETAAAGGTDIGRTQRQQLLIDALFRRFKTVMTELNISLYRNIYRFWHSQLQTDLTDADLMKLAVSQYKYIDQIEIVKTDIPIGEEPNTGVIYHPGYLVEKQWVFLPTANTFNSLQDYISQTLKN